MTKREIRLITGSFDSRPALDTAVSKAMLQRVSDGLEPETLRLSRPAAVVAFGPQDTRAPGYPRAVHAARDAGFEAVVRLGGGRAAVFHQGAISFSWTIPDRSPGPNIKARFQEAAQLIAKALTILGADARVGPVPGEYCPGQYSINARGRTKLAGLGQRLTARAAHVGGVIVVRDSKSIRDVLLPVYHGLGIAWDPQTVGSIEDEVGPISCGQVRQAIIETFASRYNLVEAAISDEALALAATLEAEHLAPWSSSQEYNEVVGSPAAHAREWRS